MAFQNKLKHVAMILATDQLNAQIFVLW